MKTNTLRSSGLEYLKQVERYNGRESRARNNCCYDTQSHMKFDRWFITKSVNISSEPGPISSKLGLINGISVELKVNYTVCVWAFTETRNSE